MSDAGKGDEENDRLHSFDGYLIELQQPKKNRADFERLQTMMYDEYQQLKIDNSPYLPSKRFITEIPGAYHKKLDLIRGELSRMHKSRGARDHELDAIVNNMYAKQGLLLKRVRT